MTRFTERPPFWNGTNRGFKEQKRKEFRAVIEAYETFRRGCAYVPGFHQNAKNLAESLEGWKEAMNVKNWGR